MQPHDRSKRFLDAGPFTYVVSADIMRCMIDAPNLSQTGFTARSDSIEHYLADLPGWWVYAFVSKYGRLFGNCRPLPKGCERGEPRRCFWNAYLLSSRHPELFYIEGFARKAIGKQDFITHHAWTADQNGRVYDPTWKGTEYFGVPFKPAYVRKAMQLIMPECFSLIDNTVDNYPLKRSKASRTWLQPMSFVL